LLSGVSLLFGIFQPNGGQGKSKKREQQTEQQIAGLNEYLVNGNY